MAPILDWRRVNQPEAVRGVGSKGSKPVVGSVPGQGAGQAAGQGFVDADVGGGVYKSRGGVSTDTAPLPAGFARAFGAKPDSTSRASGEGLDGSDPPFLTAGAVSRGGGVSTLVSTLVSTIPPLSVGVAPVSIYPCGKAPRPARWPDDDERREHPTDEQTPADYRPLFVWNREELSPMTPGRKVPFRP